MIRIIHQRAKCIGCNYCVEVAPNTWEIDKTDGKATLIGSTQKKGFYILTTTNDEFEANFEAQNICPVKIIKVEKTTK
jgi:ferredoxin